MKTLSQILFVIISLLASSITPGKSNQAEPQWSVLIITVDNLRPDRMSLYGYEKETTPFLTDFATGSAIFDNAFSTSAWTAPGMVSIFTGYYPPVHAQHGRFSFYDEEMTAALRVLAAQGYEILGQGIKGPSHQGLGFQKHLGKSPKRLESFIENRVDNKSPFFAWAHLTDVHLPYTPTEKSARQFGVTARTSEAIEAVRKHRMILRRPEQVEIELDHAGKVTFSEEDIPVVQALYDGEVADVDERLRRNLERMQETGLLDRTIVIITADHGEELFDHGWLGHASTGFDAKLYDELIHIPLIIRLPDQSLAGVYGALVQGVDLMPTILDILGISTAGMEPRMQGRSFLPVIKGDADAIREYVFSQTTLKGWNTPREEMSDRVVSVRSMAKKLIRIPTKEGVRVEGYDLHQDPKELTNIYSERVDEFRPLEQALLEWTTDNRSKAAVLVMGGAQRRINHIAASVLGGAGINAAVKDWSAIQIMEETWGLEPDRFYDYEPYASSWQKIQRLVAEMIGKAMQCRAQDGVLRTENPVLLRDVESWYCSL